MYGFSDDGDEVDVDEKASDNRKDGNDSSLPCYRYDITVTHGCRRHYPPPDDIEQVLDLRIPAVFKDPEKNRINQQTDRRHRQQQFDPSSHT